MRKRTEKENMVNKRKMRDTHIHTQKTNQPKHPGGQTCAKPVFKTKLSQDKEKEHSAL